MVKTIVITKFEPEEVKNLDFFSRMVYDSILEEALGKKKGGSQ